MAISDIPVTLQQNSVVKLTDKMFLRCYFQTRKRPTVLPGVNNWLRSSNEYGNFSFIQQNVMFFRRNDKKARNESRSSGLREQD